LRDLMDHRAHRPPREVRDVSDVDGETIEIPCPGCRAPTEKTVAWLKSHKQFTCACGTLVRVTPSTFRHEIAKVSAAVDQLKRTIDSRSRQPSSKA
jgi:hypothetical protein